MPIPPTPPRSPNPTPEAIEAVRSLARASRLIERATGDLGLAHYRVLSAVASGEDRASRVAERFELGRPTISAAVEGLCREGLLERTGVAGDQRAFELRLTQKGKNALQGVETEMVRALDDLCHHLPRPLETLDALASLGAALDARASDRLASHDGRRRATRPTGAAKS